MLITTGRVSGGSIELETGNLPEGARVTIIAPENGEVFALSADDEAKLLDAVAEAECGETIPASELLEQIRKS
jgi:hypothetical protein